MFIFGELSSYKLGCTNGRRKERLMRAWCNQTHVLTIEFKRQISYIYIEFWLQCRKTAVGSWPHLDRLFFFSVGLALSRPSLQSSDECLVPWYSGQHLPSLFALRKGSNKWTVNQIDSPYQTDTCLSVLGKKKSWNTSGKIHEDSHILVLHLPDRSPPQLMGHPFTSVKGMGIGVPPCNEATGAGTNESSDVVFWLILATPETCESSFHLSQDIGEHGAFMSMWKHLEQLPSINNSLRSSPTTELAEQLWVLIPQ